MKVVVSKTDLADILFKVQTIVPVKPSSPIVGHLLLQALDGQLIISATDLSVSITSYCGATVIEEGAIALPARRFCQLVRELTSPQIKITALSGESAEITTGTSVFKIHGMNKAEFPQAPDLSGSPQFTLPSNVLREMLTKTVFAAAREDSRYTLNGVRLQIANQKATFVGTDGKRLARIFNPIPVESHLQGQYVFSLKTVDEMTKILDETTTPVTLTVASDKVSLESGSAILTGKLLAGQYPDVERVIPTKISQQFSVHREELMSLLRQVSLFTSETTHSVRFTFETGQLHLSVMSSEVGEGKVSMPVDYTGNRLDIAFNPHFFIDILRHSKDETIRFGLIDSHNPGVITDTTNALFVIMPMRLSETTAKEQEGASVS